MFGADVIDLLTSARIIRQFVAAHVIADFFSFVCMMRHKAALCRDLSFLVSLHSVVSKCSSCVVLLFVPRFSAILFSMSPYQVAHLSVLLKCIYSLAAPARALKVVTTFVAVNKVLEHALFPTPINSSKTVKVCLADFTYCRLYAQYMAHTREIPDVKSNTSTDTCSHATFIELDPSGLLPVYTRVGWEYTASGSCKKKKRQITLKFSCCKKSTSCGQTSICINYYSYRLYYATRTEKEIPAIISYSKSSVIVPPGILRPASYD